MIKKLKLTNFRNFKKSEFEFSDDTTVLSAPNAKGKTNILESLVLLSTGKSFKARRGQEVINYNESITSITGITSNEKLEVKITTGENDWPKKRYLINDVPKRQIDFIANFKTVLFLPEDIDLVTGSPSLRRYFLDIVLSQTDREYRRAIGSYEKGIKQRNRLLLRIREEGLSRSHLLFWNQLLIKNGNYITSKRQNLINFINSYYTLYAVTYSLSYDSSIISEGRLEQYKNEEIASATTLVGPHRDDFVFQANSGQGTAYRELASYGSRGEQRMAVLWLKLAELAYIEEVTKTKPTLLLDDIFSELDHHNRKTVLDSIHNHQVIITSADPHNIEKLKIKNEKVKIINL